MTLMSMARNYCIEGTQSTSTRRFWARSSPKGSPLPAPLTSTEDLGQPISSTKYDAMRSPVQAQLVIHMLRTRRIRVPNDGPASRGSGNIDSLRPRFKRLPMMLRTDSPVHAHNSTGRRLLVATRCRLLRLLGELLNGIQRQHDKGPPLFCVQDVTSNKTTVRALMSANASFDIWGGCLDVPPTGRTKICLPASLQRCTSF